MYAAGFKKDGTVVTSLDIVDVSGWKNIMLQKKPYTATGGEMAKGNHGKTNTAELSTAYVKKTPFTGYTMNGNNYYKLRDIMNALDVYMGFDGGKKTIIVDISKGY